MRRIIGTTLALAVLLALPVEGQGRGHRGRMSRIGLEREAPVANHLLRLKERLNLTDEQVQQLEALQTVRRQVRERSRTEAEQRRTEHRSQVDALLTEEQREQVGSLRQEGDLRRGARHGRAMRQGPAGRQGPAAAGGPVGRAGFRARAFGGPGGVAWGIRGSRGLNCGMRAGAFYTQGRARAMRFRRGFGPCMFPPGG